MAWAEVDAMDNQCMRNCQYAITLCKHGETETSHATEKASQTSAMTTRQYKSVVTSVLQPL